MKLQIREQDLRAYIKGKSFSENVFDEIKALDRGDVKIKLSDINVGMYFEFGGFVWVKLADIDGASLCLSAKVITEKAFDTNNCNDWRFSTLRGWLNDFKKTGF